MPEIREWWSETLLKMKSDPRVGRIETKTLADTPITMTRNQAVHLSRQNGHHIIIMVDSDQDPNKHAREPWFQPFWDVAFDAIYEHYHKGPLVVGCPYAGPPGEVGENIYVFQWETESGVHGHETAFKLEQVPRQVAARMAGLQECAALPTGLIMYDIRAFDLIAPSGRRKRDVLQDLKDGTISIDKALRDIEEGWFRYEWNDCYAHSKGSTEDVQNTRDISLAGIEKLGYNPLWDIKADCAFPSATQNEINAKDASNLIKNGVTMVAEAANMPSNLEAMQIYLDAGILYGPAKAANAGGVATSGLEMSQNSMRLAWSREEVDKKLHGIMKTHPKNCWDTAERCGAPGNHVNGANIAGFLKVADSMIDHGVCAEAARCRSRLRHAQRVERPAANALPGPYP